MAIRPLDIPRLRSEFKSAEPFPHIVIDDFLEPDFARAVADSYPTFEEAQSLGHQFDFVRERRKIQVSKREEFPEPVRTLCEALDSKTFLADLETITGISGLEPDAALSGGGIHVTGPGGRLDVHVDFNYNEERRVHRRLNILIYLNPVWEESWGGQVELWDKDVRTCHRSVAPALNRCVLFETSDISFHGVRPVDPRAAFPRQSYAAYYYTKDAPPNWDGECHDTIFRARPDERLRRYVLIPAEQVKLRSQRFLRAVGDKLTGKS